MLCLLIDSRCGVLALSLSLTVPYSSKFVCLDVVQVWYGYRYEYEYEYEYEYKYRTQYSQYSVRVQYLYSILSRYIIQYSYSTGNSTGTQYRYLLIVPGSNGVQNSPQIYLSVFYTVNLSVLLLYRYFFKLFVD